MPCRQQRNISFHEIKNQSTVNFYQIVKFKCRQLCPAIGQLKTCNYA